MKNRIYLDHAATTPVSETVMRAMLPFFTENAGNASAVYGTGRDARKPVEDARRKVAAVLGAEPAEILFTSGGSESDNLALKGVAFAMQAKGRHLITTQIEHPAVLNTCKWLEKQGFDVTYVQPDREGTIDPEQIRKAVRKETILISVMAANNETGTIEPVAAIGRIAKEYGVLFHTDAVQAVGAISVNVDQWNADLLSLSAHKFNGPKGAGALYVRKGTRIDPLICGGNQERGLRAGTENVPGIVGLGQAIEEAAENMSRNSMKTKRLRDRLAEGILMSVQGSRMNGTIHDRLPNNCNICFERIDGEALLLRLDLAGIAVSGGSACTSGSQKISHVLRAMGLTEDEAKGSLRFTAGAENTEEEIDETISTVKTIVEDLRQMLC